MDFLSKFRKLMSDHNITISQCAEALGMSPQSLSYKLQGVTCFTNEERDALADIIGKAVVYDTIPELAHVNTVNSNLRILRQACLKKTLEEVANDLGVGKNRVLAFENRAVPPVDYLQKFATTYHIPCSLLLNVNEDTWSVSTEENLILKAVNENTRYYEYAAKDLTPLQEHRRKLELEARDTIRDLDYEGLEELDECICRIHRSHSVELQQKAYREIVSKITVSKCRIRRTKNRQGVTVKSNRVSGVKQESQ